MMAVMLFVMVPRAAASSERIDAVLATEPAITDPAVPQPEGPGRGVVSFDHVTFRYPGAEDPVLEDVSFTARRARPPRSWAAPGPGRPRWSTSSPRLYDASEGRVCLDGVDVRDLRQADVWASMAIVPQKAFLFSGTVASNVRFGRPDASDAEVWQALRTAQVEDFVRELPEAWTPHRSGRRQRLRRPAPAPGDRQALVRQAEVLILDDSFSAWTTPPTPGCAARCARARRTPP